MLKNIIISQTITFLGGIRIINAEKIMSALTQVGSMLDLGDPFDRQKYVVLLSSGFEREKKSR